MRFKKLIASKHPRLVKTDHNIKNPPPKKRADANKFFCYLLLKKLSVMLLITFTILG